MMEIIDTYLSKSKSDKLVKFEDNLSDKVPMVGLFGTPMKGMNYLE